MAVTEQTTLALTMRPRDFDEVIGLEKPIALIKSKIDKNEIPRAFLLRGPYGTGKTTLAHIIARYVQGPFFEGKPSIHEVNAANYRKIENMRVLADEAMQHTMSVLKEAGAKVTVETELATSKNFVLHTVVAEMPKKEHPVQFTKAGA